MLTEIQTKIALQLPLRSLRIFHAEGEKNYPEECCGFLFGHETADRRVIREARPVTNVQTENRRRRFLITPEEFRAAERHAQATGRELLGFYHSHPDHPAIPSDFDREHALPYYSYVIVSVQKGRAAETRSWQLDDDRDGYHEETIEIK
jgi:proteasome lid subunit RPN8/RPN11